MIKEISIARYKSVVDLTLKLDRFNVFIGENGCGKSNILEAIALGEAAHTHKLDYEFLANRGIRVTEPQFMLPAFDDIENNKDIKLAFKDDSNNSWIHLLHYDQETKPAMWRDEVEENTEDLFIKLQQYLSKKEQVSLDDFIKIWAEKYPNNDINFNISESPFTIRKNKSKDLTNFTIYSLEESSLRKFDTANTYPLGRKGEGLFAYLKSLSQQEKGLKIFQEIREGLSLLDWFEDIQIPENLMSSDYSLKLSDRYLSETLNYFDQRSANEGFLYLLFYLTLFISDDTPSFFAIENIESSYNPKLCREIVKRLYDLAVKHNKQVILTTHSPAVLNALPYSNEEQKLFVVRRTVDGYTKANVVERKGETDTPMGQLWETGMIGGLPNNF